MIKEFKDLKEVQIIIFRLGKEEYAVPIMNVQEIIMRQDPTHIPKTPDFVEGIINLRGRIIPVIDGRKKFQITGKEINTGNSRIMVMDVENEIVGIIVDEVSEVVHLNTADIDPAPVDTSGEDENFLWGIGKTKDKLLILLNPNKFLSHHETQSLMKFTSVVDTIKSEEIIHKKSTV